MKRPSAWEIVGEAPRGFSMAKGPVTDAEFLLGPKMQSSSGYYSRKLFESFRGVSSGQAPPAPTQQVGPPGSPPPDQVNAPGQVRDPNADPAAQGAGPPAQGRQEPQRFSFAT